MASNEALEKQKILPQGLSPSVPREGNGQAIHCSVHRKPTGSKQASYNNMNHGLPWASGSTATKGFKEHVSVGLIVISIENNKEGMYPQ